MIGRPKSKDLDLNRQSENHHAAVAEVRRSPRREPLRPLRDVLCILIVISFCLAGCHHSAARLQGKPKLAMWYWHSPFQLSSTDLGLLKQIGVEELYVRAGTLSTDGDRIHLILPQKFQPGPSPPIHLVINADPGVLHRFDDLSMSDLAQTIVLDYQGAKKAATDDGLEVKGLQLDIDVPTRLLPKYAQLIRDLRPKLPREDKLSITSLATWFTSDDLEEVVRQLDFYAPQFYEASVPRDIFDEKTIANLPQLENGLKAAEKLGTPFMIGAPSYGQALLFDAQGRLAGTYRGLSPEDACRHPSLRVKNWICRDGEERLTMQAVKPGMNGKGLGYQIVYRRPTPQAIAEFYRTALQDRPANCMGIALFRVPEQGESLATPLLTLQAALGQQVPIANLHVVPKLTRRTYGAIESPKGEIENELEIDIESQGNSDTCIGPAALEVELRFPTGAVEEIQPGGFAGAKPFADDLGTIGHVSLARSNGAILWRAHLAPGEKIHSGPVLLKGAGRLTIMWSVTDPTGTVTKGEIPPIEFGNK